MSVSLNSLMIILKDLILREIDLKIGLLDTDGIDKRTALFKAGTEPVEYEGKFKGGITY